MESGKYSIVIDAMGGDYSPGEIVKGAYEAGKSLGANIILTGDREKIKEAALLNMINPEELHIFHTTQVIAMDESPSAVLKSKKDSSIYVGARIVSEGKGEAFLSAGNTGAAMACSLLNMKRIEGVLRPAIAVVIPIANGRFVLIDAGANADCKPQYLKQFAVMGKIYAENILKINNPRIALINIGQEEKKGNELSIQSHILLKEANNLNFIGNIEGRELFNGETDVAVCDGFVGNIILKSVEGLASMFFREIKNAFMSSMVSKISALCLKKNMIEMKKKFDYEEYGGAYLLGLNGSVVISHGSSKSRAIYNAVKVALEGVKSNLVDKIRDEIK